jgi:hypothetical protein
MDLLRARAKLHEEMAANFSHGFIPRDHPGQAEVAALDAQIARACDAAGITEGRAWDIYWGQE